MTLIVCVLLLLGLHEQRRPLLLTAAMYTVGAIGADIAWLIVAGLEHAPLATAVEHPLLVEAHLALRDQIGLPLTLALLCAKALLLCALLVARC